MKSVLEKALEGKVTKVYPAFANHNAKMPFLVYRRTGIQASSTKSRGGIDQCAMDFNAYTESYAEGVEIIEIVRKALEKQRFVYSSKDGSVVLKIDCTAMMDCEEGTNESGDLYVQSVTFEFKTSNPL